MDEAEVISKYINALVGSLDTPNEAFLVECLPLESSSNVNSSVILHSVDDVLRQLGTKRENFALLLTECWQKQNSLALHTAYITALCEFVLSLKLLMT